MSRKPSYANANAPLVAAAINGLYRFETVEAAQKKLHDVTKHHILSREQEEDPPLPSKILWVRDYEISPEEEEQGYLGHFACLRVAKADDGCYMLEAKKVEIELKYHPQRHRSAQPMPNWGHPVLRKIQKGELYSALEFAQADLQQLQLEYPQTTIPATNNKLYLMVYSRAETPEEPVQKYVLEIEATKDGQFLVKCEKNVYEPPLKRPAKARAPLAEDEESPASDKLAAATQQNEDHSPPPEAPKGYFTARVQLKRGKK